MLLINEITLFLDNVISLINLHSILLMCIGTLLGLSVGAMPGLTATMACALLLGITYSMSVEDALIILLAVFAGAMTGGSISAILVNVPGTPAAAATAIDGHILARAGKATETIRLASVGSCMGTIMSALFLLLLAPLLLTVALNFGVWEYALLGIVGVLMCGSATREDIPLKGWISGFIGLLLSMVGQDKIWCYPRFCYGITQLQRGFSLVPALVGLFGVTEILYMMGKKEEFIIEYKHKSEIKLPKFSIFFYIRKLGFIIKSALIGIFIGIIPGVGGEIATWVSYNVARWGSKNKKLFGKGNYEGVLASETANNATVGGVLIPALTLAIPGGAVAAVILAGLWLHGIRPGPLLEIEFPGFTASTAAMIFVISFVMLAWSLSLAGFISKVLLLPTELIMAGVAVLCVIGSYSIELRLFDVYIALGFGVFGYLLHVMKYPRAPLILGIILGPVIDENLRRALMLSKSIIPFFTRPVSLMLIIVLVLLIIVPFFQTKKSKKGVE